MKHPVRALIAWCGCLTALLLAGKTDTPNQREREPAAVRHSSQPTYGFVSTEGTAEERGTETLPETASETTSVTEGSALRVKAQSEQAGGDSLNRSDSYSSADLSSQFAKRIEATLGNGTGVSPEAVREYRQRQWLRYDAAVAKDTEIFAPELRDEAHTSLAEPSVDVPLPYGNVIDPALETNQTSSHAEGQPTGDERVQAERSARLLSYMQHATQIMPSLDGEVLVTPE